MKILSRILIVLLAFLLMVPPCPAESFSPISPGTNTGPSLVSRTDMVYANAIGLRPRSCTLYWWESKPGKCQLTLRTIPDLAQLTEGGNPVTWESKNEQVAKVTKADGNIVEVTAQGIGTTQIYARVQGRSRMLSVSCRVRVKGIPVRSITLNTDHLDFDLSKKGSGLSAQLKANVLPKNASSTRVIWSSSDDNVATVDQTGLVQAEGRGVCTITAADAMGGKKKATVKVRCIDPDKMVPVVFTAGGDLVLGGDKRKGTDRRFAELVKKDYGYVLRNLQSLLSNDDFSIFNLEGPLVGGGSPRKPSRSFNFYGKPEYVNILRQGSVEVVNVVNNHINDYGTKGQTLSILRRTGKPIVISDEQIKSEANVMTVTKEGEDVRVGFIGFFGPVSTRAVSSRIKKAKSKCNVLVASFHFCDAKEHSHLVYGSQIRQARAAVDAGATVVLGHHTHVPSGIELYKGVYIYYGLGSTQSSGKNFGRRDIYNTFLTRQTIRWDPYTDYTLCEVPTIYPICPTGAPVTEENNCQPIFLGPGDDRYRYVLDVLDKYSRTGDLNPAPFNLA